MHLRSKPGIDHVLRGVLQHNYQVLADAACGKRASFYLNGASILAAAHGHELHRKSGACVVGRLIGDHVPRVDSAVHRAKKPEANRRSFWKAETEHHHIKAALKPANFVAPDDTWIPIRRREKRSLAARALIPVPQPPFSVLLGGTSATNKGDSE
jgi:hypothetical protein